MDSFSNFYLFFSNKFNKRKQIIHDSIKGLTLAELLAMILIQAVMLMISIMKYCLGSGGGCDIWDEIGIL